MSKQAIRSKILHVVGRACKMVSYIPAQNSQTYPPTEGRASGRRRVSNEGWRLVDEIGFRMSASGRVGIYGIYLYTYICIDIYWLAVVLADGRAGGLVCAKAGRLYIGWSSCSLDESVGGIGLGRSVRGRVSVWGGIVCRS